MLILLPHIHYGKRNVKKLKRMITKASDWVSSHKIISFKDSEGNSHEVIAAKDVCMKGMPKVKMFIKDSEDGNYIADYKLDFE